MKRLPLLLLACAITLILSLQTEQKVVASPQANPSSSPLLHLLDARNERAYPPMLRDPFYGEPPAPALDEATAPLSAPSRSAASTFPAFRILGKQEDETGWSVFISLPGPNTTVWVVHEGETFNEQYRVTKLVPPTLTIQRRGSQHVRTFDIGKDEE